jgi:Arc/MetJ-type ribon-helix-helix transcriptional regulator
MRTKKEKQKQPDTVARLVRLPGQLDDWLASYAQEHGYSSAPDLVRHIVREFKRQVEQEQRSAA